ncbi:PorT family protein [bacterium]|nr:PorT family protein [bacterium]
MKPGKFLLVCILALVCAIPAEAQRNRIGFVAGLSIAKLEIDSGNLDTKTGLAIGGILDFVLDERFTVRVSPIFIQKGAKQTVTDDEDLGAADFTFDVNYFEVPILVKYGAYAGLVRPYVLFGPTVGFNLSSTRRVRAQSLREKTDIEAAFRIFDIGAAVGGGMSFPVHDHLFFIEGRYGFGLVNVLQDPQFSQFVRALEFGEHAKTRNIQFMAGMSFLF